MTAEGGLGDGMAMGQQSGMVRQVRALFKRRLQIARRDKKTLFLQCVLPLITVTVSAVFGSLQNIGDSGAGGFLMSPATFASAVVDQYAGRHPFYLFTAANTGEERRPVTYPGLYHVLSSSTIEYMNRRECVFRFVLVLSLHECYGITVYDVFVLWFPLANGCILMPVICIASLLRILRRRCKHTGGKPHDKGGRRSRLPPPLYCHHGHGC